MSLSVNDLGKSLIAGFTVAGLITVFNSVEGGSLLAADALNKGIIGGLITALATVLYLPFRRRIKAMITSIGEPDKQTEKH
ncbi:MAG: hypothetical protein AAGH38_07795 [Pseudomonadota bacterium]